MSDWSGPPCHGPACPGHERKRSAACRPGGLARGRQVSEVDAVWDQPYLETCCRAALHRLYLAGPAGRPADQMDAPCLVRLAGMGLCDQRSDERFTLNPEGTQRHATEVLKQPMIRSPAPTKGAP